MPTIAPGKAVNIALNVRAHLGDAQRLIAREVAGDVSPGFPSFNTDQARSSIGEAAKGLTALKKDADLKPWIDEQVVADLRHAAAMLNKDALPITWRNTVATVDGSVDGVLYEVANRLEHAARWGA